MNRIDVRAVVVAVAVGLLATAAARADIFVSGFDRTATGQYSRVLRYTDAGQLVSNQFVYGGESINAIAVGNDGMVYVAGNTLGYGTISRLNPQTGAFSANYWDGTDGSGKAVYSVPAGIAIAGDGSLYAASNVFSPIPNGVRGLLKFDTVTGKYVRKSVQRPGTTIDVGGVAVGPDGRAYITVNSDGVVRTDGTTAGDTFIPAGSGGLHGGGGYLAFGPDGSLYVSDYTYANGKAISTVLRFDGNTGAFLGTFLGSDAGLGNVRALAFVGQSLLVANDANMIQRFDASSGVYQNTLTVPANVSLGSIAVGVPEPACTGLLTAGCLILRRRR